MQEIGAANPGADFITGQNSSSAKIWEGGNSSSILNMNYIHFICLGNSFDNEAAKRNEKKVFWERIFRPNN